MISMCSSYLTIHFYLKFSNYSVKLYHIVKSLLFIYRYLKFINLFMHLRVNSILSLQTLVYRFSSNIY